MFDSGGFLSLLVEVVFAVPRYGFMFFPGYHLGPDGSRTHAYPLPHVMSSKGPETLCVSGSFTSTGGFSVSFAWVLFAKWRSIGGSGSEVVQFRKLMT